ncbi:unnamed protein product [Paramecium octaurelia]|uniref:Uncharacterized protein n=1 Tax=Paramecium octaurelia TaxID=43137 RepID=A0A8S1UBB1_PAROT|nr:unnamed protein product [Paramecium octaurelia]
MQILKVIFTEQFLNLVISVFWNKLIFPYLWNDQRYNFSAKKQSMQVIVWQGTFNSVYNQESFEQLLYAKIQFTIGVYFETELIIDMLQNLLHFTASAIPCSHQTIDEIKNTLTNT